jgi:hypothetical protein
MRAWCLSVVLVGAVGCAAHEKPAERTQRIVPASVYLAKDGTVTGGVAPKGNFVCDMETPLGSHMAQRVCRYVDDDDESRSHRLQTQDALRTHGVCAVQGDGAKCLNDK